MVVPVVKRTVYMPIDEGMYLIFKEALYRIGCGANRLGDSGVHTLGDSSAFVNPAGQLLLPGGVRPEWIPSAYYLNSIQPLFKFGAHVCMERLLNSGGIVCHRRDYSRLDSRRREVSGLALILCVWKVSMSKPQHGNVDLL